MAELFKDLFSYGLENVIIILLIIIAFIPKVFDSWQKMLDSLGLISKKEIKESEDEKLIKELQSKIANQQKHIEDAENKQKQYEQKRIHDREQSFEKQDKIDKRFEKIDEKMDSITNLIIEMQKKSDASERARLKDRISELYQHYHQTSEWTHMDKETFKDLIQDFENRGEYNTFVHEICEPESHTWRIIDKQNLL